MSPARSSSRATVFALLVGPLLFAVNVLAQHVVGLARQRVGYSLLVILGPGTVLSLAVIARLTALGLSERPHGGVGAEALKIAGGAEPVYTALSAAPAHGPNPCRRLQGRPRRRQGPFQEPAR